MGPPDSHQVWTALDDIKKKMLDHEYADIDRFNDIDLKLAGIGADGTPLATRLDRLERTQRLWGKVCWMILAAILALLGERISARIATAESPQHQTSR